MHEPLVFLPAMMCNAQLFAPQTAVLSARVPIIHMPLTQAERMEDYASQVLTTVAGRFTLIGADLGGMVAMEVLRRAPDRVAKVVLIGTTPLAEGPDHAAAREPLIVRARAGALPEVMDEMLPGSAFAPGEGAAQTRREVMEMAAHLGPEVFARQTRALQRRRDQQQVLRGLSQPTLIICGGYQDIYPLKRHKAMAGLIPSARLEVIDQAGHFPTLEAPDETSALIKGWLSHQ